MTEIETLQRDIDTLRESVHRGWREISTAGSAEDRARLQQHLQVCIDDLKGLLDRLDIPPPNLTD